jgi:hypothetical protein
VATRLTGAAGVEKDDLLTALAGQARCSVDRKHQHPDLLDELFPAALMRALHRLSLGITTPVVRILDLHAAAIVGR